MARLALVILSLATILGAAIGASSHVGHAMDAAASQHCATCVASGTNPVLAVTAAPMPSLVLIAERPPRGPVAAVVGDTTHDASSRAPPSL